MYDASRYKGDMAGERNLSYIQTYKLPKQEAETIGELNERS